MKTFLLNYYLVFPSSVLLAAPMTAWVLPNSFCGHWEKWNNPKHFESLLWVLACEMPVSFCDPANMTMENESVELSSHRKRIDELCEQSPPLWVSCVRGRQTCQLWMCLSMARVVSEVRDQHCPSQASRVILHC